MEQICERVADLDVDRVHAGAELNKAAVAVAHSLIDVTWHMLHHRRGVRRPG